MVDYSMPAIIKRLPPENAAFTEGSLTAHLDQLQKQGRRIVPVVVMDVGTNSGDLGYLSKLGLDAEYRSSINGASAGVLVTDPATLQHDLGLNLPSGNVDRMVFFDTKNHALISRPVTEFRDGNPVHEETLVRKEAYLMLKNAHTLNEEVGKIEKLVSHERSKEAAKEIGLKATAHAPADLTEMLVPSSAPATRKNDSGLFPR